jgi:hypothetical protein
MPHTTIIFNRPLDGDPMSDRRIAPSKAFDIGLNRDRFPDNILQIIGKRSGTAIVHLDLEGIRVVTSVHHGGV